MRTPLVPTSIICLSLSVCGCALNKDPNAKVEQSVSASETSLIQVYAQTIVAAANPSSGTAGKCADCHTSSGAEGLFPFADPNPSVAFNDGITTLGIVNVGNPSASLILQYLTNGHCGGTECQVTSGSTVYQSFLSAVQAYATAATSAGSSAPGPSPGPSAAPSQGPTLVPVASLGGVMASPVPLPGNPPLLGNSPLILNIPLLAANAGVGTSSIQLSVVYTVMGTNSAGATVFVYDLSNPMLLNGTTTESITLAGFYIGLNGTVDLGNNIFSNAKLYQATATPGATQALFAAGALDSITLSASPGDSLTLVIENLTTGPP